MIGTKNINYLYYLKKKKLKTSIKKKSHTFEGCNINKKYQIKIKQTELPHKKK